ncbi:MAG: lytic transglycosylase domain-containing protein [Nitrospirales bacterium]|nr:lytic transglycosylase domain-containing protein [Nitrospirales bacterium]
MILLLAIALLLFSGTISHADIYQTVGEDGTIFFTNTAPGRTGKVFIRERKPASEPRRKQERKASLPLPPENVPAVSREEMHSIVEERARQHEVDAGLVKAVIRTESNWNPLAVSPKGARGLMQLMPGTASLLGVMNPFDPVENIDGGIRYLKMLLEKFSGDLPLALAAYNAGPKRVERSYSIPSIPETVAYVKKVISHYSGSNTEVAKISTGEIRKSVTKIRKLIQEDGTILFTNSYRAGSYSENQAVR